MESYTLNEKDKKVWEALARFLESLATSEESSKLVDDKKNKLFSKFSIKRLFKKWFRSYNCKRRRHGD